MRRPVGKHKSSRYVVTCVLLFGFCLLYDYFWASSPRFTSVVSYWSPAKAVTTVVLPDDAPAKEMAGKSEKAPGRKLSATFADLPGPELEWEKMATVPVPRLDGAVIQIKNLLFVFAGYGTVDYVHSRVDIYNFSNNSWGGRFDMPKDMAHSHLGMKPKNGKIFLPYQFLGVLADSLVFSIPILLISIGVIHILA
ncbi:hypothetical protein MLD38_028359 [Melastoma candidum]|uniref:Uncharacterized protein n=1 Tax=Melastoma candidum TaxID=119954 RepID=A0ACB9N2K2_9MYRT|nr:hypothetical protein MLD38_028359 [Melastoma candidum]